MLVHFLDRERGGFFLSADDGEELFVRAKEYYDGAIPSGNSVAASNLLRLHRITGREEYAKAAEDTLRSFSEWIVRSPMAYTQLLLAVDFACGPSFEVVLAGDPEADDLRAMRREIQRRFAPNKVLLLRPEGAAPPITRIAAFTEPQVARDGKATAYVCRDFACEAPTTSWQDVIESLKGR
jgi:uncharacterized protein YyaL (SSP411 family)